MLRQTPDRRHRLLAPANSDLESSHESRPGYHRVEVYPQAGPTQVSLHNHAVEVLVVRCGQSLNLKGCAEPALALHRTFPVSKALIHFPSNHFTNLPSS